VPQAIKSASIDLPKVMMGNYWALFFIAQECREIVKFI